jgi:hypothetical protein
MNAQGDTKMKKLALALLLSIPLLSGVSLASSFLGETPLLPAGNLSALMLTASPIASPEPAPEPDYSKITLDPRLVSIGQAQAILGPRFRGSGFSDSMFTASLVSMVALNVADFFSTKACLKYPNLSEGNPLMKPFVKNAAVFAAVKGGLTIASFLGTKALYKHNKTLGWIVSLASNLALSLMSSPITSAS